MLPLTESRSNTMLFLQAFNEECQSTFCDAPDSSFKALWLSPDLKSSSPPRFLHGKKKKSSRWTVFSTNPNKCHRGAKDFIFSNFWSGFGLVLCQFSQSSPWQDLDNPNLHASHTKKLTGVTGQGKKLLIFSKPQTILQNENIPSGQTSSTARWFLFRIPVPTHHIQPLILKEAGLGGCSWC